MRRPHLKSDDLRRELSLLDDSIAFAIEGHDEFDRITADGAILDEALPPTPARVDGDVILLGTFRAGVGRIAL